MKEWKFTPLDSCFFRGAQPFNAGEGGFVDSIFPPTAQTMTGMIRSAIGEANNINWGDYRKQAYLPMGEIDQDGCLHCSGPYLLHNGERLFPMPLNLLHNRENSDWSFLIPSKQSYKCDINEGKEVHLPTPKNQKMGGKPLASAWLTRDEMQKVLNGEHPSNLVDNRSIIQQESRTGIGRNNHTRLVQEGLLYFTRHLRLHAGVSLAMQVSNADEILPDGLIRFGGEGRMAALDISETSSGTLEPMSTGGNPDGYVIYLLTHGDFAGKGEPELPEEIKIISACIGKAIREGGWDYLNGQAKPVKSLIPAGSCYFVEGSDECIRALHGTKIGENTAFGYGEIAIGQWRREA